MTSPLDSLGSQSGPFGASGRIEGPKIPTVLHVASGLYDDARQALRGSLLGDAGTTPSDPLFGLALHAWHYQDTWEPAEHESFWAGLLPRWPYRRGQRATRRTLATWAAQMRRRGLSDAQIADALGYETDTLRRDRTFEVGEMLLQERDEMEPTLRPRVYADFEDEPLGGRLNLPIPPWFTLRRLGDGFAIARVAQRRLREAQGQRRSLLGALQHLE